MQITHDLGLGGLEQVIVTLLRTIDRSRFEPSILCLRKIGPMAERLNGIDIPIFQVPWSPHRPNYLAFREVGRILREQRINVIHTHNTWAFVDGGLGGLLAGVKTHIHTDHARSFPDHLRLMVAEHVMSHLTYKVVGVSQDSAEKLRRYEKIPRRKLTVITNGIETDRYRCVINAGAKRRELGIGDRAPIIGLNARLTEQKGITYLLQCLPVIRARFPNVMLLVAGEGNLLDKLMAEAAQLGVSDHVRFLGLRTDAHELLQLYDVYASASLWEGLPMSLLEAMAARRAIVSTDVGGVSTAIEHGVNGTLVGSRDPQALATAIIELLESASLRERYGDAASRLVDLRFSAEAMTRRYEQLYLRLPELPDLTSSGKRTSPWPTGTVSR